MFLSRYDLFPHQQLVTFYQIYIRSVSDRLTDYKDFEDCKRIGKKEMVEYVDILNKTDLQNYQNIAITFNYHFAGFGPQSANTFLKLMDKPETKDWIKEIEKEQKKLE